MTITDLVIPTRSAILLATRIPSLPSISSKIWVMASSSEKESVLIADFTIWTFLVSSAFSSFTERIISSPTTVVPYSLKIISSISYGSFSRYTNSVPSRSPAMSIGVMIAVYFLMSFTNPNVSRLTFSFVDRIPSKRSFSNGSINPPTSSTISSRISSTPSVRPVPNTFPFLLITRMLEFKISLSTSQISLNTTFDELLLCSNLLIFLVLSNN